MIVFNECVKKICVHKDLFPFEGIEIAGTICIIIGSAISHACGAGAGPLDALICLVFIGFDTHTAVPLAQIIVAGESLITIMIYAKQRHPARDKPLIYWNLVMVLISPLLLGSSIGVILNKVLPEWLILALLTVLLFFICWDSLKEGIKLYKKETARKNGGHQSEDNNLNEQHDSDNEERSVKKDSHPNENSNQEPTDTNGAALTNQDVHHDAETEVDPKLTSIYHNERRAAPILIVLIIAVIYFIVLLGSFMKGGKDVKSIIHLPQCSIWYWIFIIGFICALLLIAISTRKFIIHEAAEKQKLGYNFDNHDIKWNPRNTIQIGLITFFAGSVSGLVGTGSGSILNPFMFHLGIRAEVISASLSFIVFFTSSISAIQYLIAGSIPHYYGIWMFTASLFGSCFGTFIILKIVEKYERVSLLEFTFAFSMIISLIGIPLYCILDIAREIENGNWQYGIGSFC